MITAAENRPWPGDVRIADARRAGLAIPSVVRPTKIATIEAAQASRIGRIAAGEQRAVRGTIGEILV
jgi:mRNA interferase MazF